MWVWGLPERRPAVVSCAGCCSREPSSHLVAVPGAKARLGHRRQGTEKGRGLVRNLRVLRQRTGRDGQPGYNPEARPGAAQPGGRGLWDSGPGGAPPPHPAPPGVHCLLPLPLPTVGVGGLVSPLQEVLSLPHWLQPNSAQPPNPVGGPSWSPLRPAPWGRQLRSDPLHCWPQPSHCLPVSQCPGEQGKGWRQAGVLPNWNRARDLGRSYHPNPSSTPHTYCANQEARSKGTLPQDKFPAPTRAAVGAGRAWVLR